MRWPNCFQLLILKFLLFKSSRSQSWDTDSFTLTQDAIDKGVEDISDNEISIPENLPLNISLINLNYVSGKNI